MSVADDITGLQARVTALEAAAANHKLWLTYVYTLIDYIRSVALGRPVALDERKDLPEPPPMQ